ncbi:hypothetical protein [Cutibacterium granulosum]|uniref:Alpha beta-propellor repeat-containing integrin n=1 Tax=Cutibacterium granulosum DSM 20700 TaxID=1160719 RepID=U1GD41_9ACTN|nr:hypothetical protein [Cutibacterium granulosum]ERF54924.1 alpha beta-propellor repeat-containing integrin [Cutibacterium granulosum DSM 20700]
MGKTMVRWVTGGLAAVMAAGGLVVPAWAEDWEHSYTPTASDSQWHPGWCNKDEEGYSVLIDFSLLPAKERAGLNPATTKLTDDHVKDGWLVRCHKGLEPVRDALGDASKDDDAWQEPENWAAGVGTPVVRNSDGWPTIWGIANFSDTSDGKLIKTNMVSVLPGEDGTLPSWPENVTHGGNYPGRPKHTSFPPKDVPMPEKPIKGMAVEIAAFTEANDELHLSYVVGENANRPEHRPQYADVPVPTTEPTVSPTPTQTPTPTTGPTQTPTETPTSEPTADPTLTPLPTPDPEPSETTDPTPEPEQIPTASADQWHPGWCAKDEEGYSVLIDMAALDPKDRGDLNPATTTYTDAHVKDGWLVRCHKGLEPLKYAPSGEWGAKFKAANWAASVGIPGTRDLNGWYHFLGITPNGDETSDGDWILAGALTVVPDKDGILPPWPEKVVEGEPYPGAPINDPDVFPSMTDKPVKGMAVAIGFEPDGHTDDPNDPDKKFYFAGDNPNRPEHRPQYADAPAPTPEPTPTVVPTPTVSPTPTASPTGTPTPTGTVTPTLTPLPTPDTKPSRTTTPAPNASVNPPDSTVRPVDGRDGRGDAEIPAVPGPDGGSLAAPALPATGA